MNAAFWTPEKEAADRLQSVRKRRRLASRRATAYAVHAKTLITTAGDNPAEAAAIIRSARLLQRRAARQRSCVETLVAHITGSEDDSRLVVKANRRCNLVGCEICAPYRARERYRTIVARYEIAQKRIPGLIPIHAVVTQLPTPMAEFGQGVDRLIAGLRNLSMMPRFRRAFVAWSRSIEATIAADFATAHVHAHMLLLAPPDYFSRTNPDYLHQSTFLELWRNAMRDDRIVNVHIKRLRARDGSLDHDGLLHSLHEMAKYHVVLPVKAHNESEPMPPHVYAAISQGFYRKRLIAFSGVLAARWKPKAGAL